MSVEHRRTPRLVTFSAGASLVQLRSVGAVLGIAGDVEQGHAEVTEQGSGDVAEGGADHDALRIDITHRPAGMSHSPTAVMNVTSTA